MKNDGCAWLHGGYFCFKNWLFYSTKADIIVLKLQLCDWGWEVCKGLGLEIDNKICNVRQNVGFILIFNG
jgi:hypothetical protein